MSTMRFAAGAEAGYVLVRDLLASRGESATTTVSEAEQLGQEVRYYFPGSENELQLFEVRCAPHAQGQPHAHDEDEVMYVLEGVMHFGNRRCVAGDAVYISGGTLYGFRAGEEGCRFLNFRPRRDNSFHTKAEFGAARRAPAVD